MSTCHVFCVHATESFFLSLSSNLFNVQQRKQIHLFAMRKNEQSILSHANVSENLLVLVEENEENYMETHAFLLAQIVHDSIYSIYIAECFFPRQWWRVYTTTCYKVTITNLIRS